MTQLNNEVWIGAYKRIFVIDIKVCKLFIRDPYLLQTYTQTVLNDAHSGRINAITIDPKGRVWTGSQDCLVNVWEGKTRIYSLQSHESSVYSLCLVGNLMWSGAVQSILIWDTEVEPFKNFMLIICLDSEMFGRKG
jgi:ligand-binding sensor domain-containing protein